MRTPWRAIIVAASAALVLAPAAPAAKEPRPAKPRFDPARILVKFRDPAAAPTIVAHAGDKAVSHVTGRVELVGLQRGETVAAKLAEYRARPDVVYAEPNYIVVPEALGPPSDELFGQQWGLERIEAVAGWSVFPGSFPVAGGVKVAVVDTGVYAGHPDLLGRVDLADGAGCLGVSLVCSSASSSADDHGHGTHVAGIVAATTDNGTGIAGLASSSPIVPVKVCFADETRGCPIASIANAIAWSVAHGARVVNLSLGGPGYSATVCAAVAKAVAAGVAVVAADGNQAVRTPFYPAACPGAIGVAATGPDDDSSFYANWDYPNVFVSAPGGNDFGLPPTWGDPTTEILSTVPYEIYTRLPGLYESFQGTSMASPYVAALAALLYDERPARTTADVRRILAKTADKVGAAFGYYGVPYGGSSRGADPFHVCRSCTWHPYWGYGRINVRRALVGGAPVVTAFTPTRGVVGTIVTVKGEDLARATSVSVGGQSTSALLSSPNENTARFAVPAGAHTGKIAVTTPAGTATSAVAFAVGPAISSFAPVTGPAGTTVVVHGTNLGGATALRVGGVVAPIVSTSDTAVSFTVPSPAPSGTVAVTTPSGTATSATRFTGIRPPIVSSLLPGAGPVGSTVTIGGSSLASATKVTFAPGVDAAAITVVSATSIRVAVPAGATTGKVAVTNPAGVGTSLSPFKVSPRITGFDPASGPRGSSVTISGDNLAGATAVRFGTIGAAGLVSNPDGSITVTVPATAVTGKISVTTPAGTGTSATAFVVVLPPSISSFSPASGPVGTTVTVNGANVGSATHVSFGGVESASITALGANAISAVVPPGAVTGPITVSGAVGGPASSATSFKVTPKVTGFDPGSGAAGAAITVHGSSFGGATAVRFGGIAASFAVLDGATIAATVPAGAATGPISVTTPSGTGASAARFVVVKPPSVSGFSPLAAPTGTTISLTGLNLGTVTSVAFGGGATTTALSYVSGTIRVAVPAAAVTGKITVTNAAGSATSAGAFKVVPTISGVSPSSALVGATIAVHGTTLTGATAVRIGTVAATDVHVVDGGTVTAVVPSAATTAKVSVTTPGGTATSAAALTVIHPPTISSFSPASGWAGSTVTVAGTNLDSVTAVTFGGAEAAAIVPVSPTQLRAVVPADAVTGKLAVTNAAGTAVSATDFSIPLTITSTPPPAGIGDWVTLTGTGFANVTLVAFNGTPALFFVASPTRIDAAVPGLATTGPISVTTMTGETAYTPGDFVLGPKITEVAPQWVAVGDTLTITGTSLAGATSVHFPGAAATSFSAASDGKTVTAVVPLGARMGYVSVTTPAGTATAPFDQAISIQPTIQGYSPAGGKPGATVTITGKGFSDVYSVWFGGAVDTTPAVDANGTHITAEVPDGAYSHAITVQGPLSASTRDDVGTCTPLQTGCFVVPGVAGVAPAGAPSGQQVTISGAGLVGVSSVTFGGIAATGVSSSADGSTVTATVPPGATSGDPLVVATAYGSVTGDDYNLFGISGFSPASGARGSFVTIEGGGFLLAGDVDFGSVQFGGVPSTEYQVDGPHQIIARVPNGAVTGKITVTTPDGAVTSAQTFTVTG